MILITPVSVRLLRLPCLTGPLQQPFPSLHWAASRVVRDTLETKHPALIPTKRNLHLSLRTHDQNKNRNKKDSQVQ